jgi:ribose transport system permease protein
MNPTPPINPGWHWQALRLASDFALRHAPLLLLALVFLTFGLLSDRFLTLDNARNILVQSSSVGIVAVGMTIVLLTGGIDLSVGSIMFVAAAIVGKMILSPSPPPLPIAITLILLIGIAAGAANAFFIAALRLLPFVVTLASMFIFRGYALWLTETRAMNLPESFLRLGHARVLGIPFPVLLLAAVVIAAHVLLAHTPFGRRLYATGHNPAAAAKAGIRTRPILFTVYVISGLCAALGGVVSVAQLGAVSPTFGNQREFAAIAAAVLGGTSLFGGRGSVLPGTLLGAVLIQSVETGLNIIDANPYSYPVAIGTIIFLAVLLDRLRASRADSR